MKVLIPTDFCAFGHFAYDIAEKIRAKTDVEVHFLHVVHLPREDESHEGEDFHPLLQQAEREMEIWTQGKVGETHVVAGRLTDTMIKFSEQLDVDLILMGNESREGWKEVFSTNENTLVARKGKAPLLSLMCDRRDLVISKFLFVHDFFESVKIDMGVFKKLADALEVEIHFLQVIKESEDATSLMDDFAKQHGLSEVTFHHFKCKSVENGIRGFLEEKDMDMLSIGIHSRKTLKSKILGSNVEAIHNHLHKPVLTIQMEKV